MFIVLATIISCERIAQQDVPSYAVVTGKNISSIGIFNSESELLGKYDYTYDVTGNVASVDHDGVHYTYLYYNEMLVNIISDDPYTTSWVLTYNEDDMLIGYAVYMHDVFVVKYIFDYKESKIVSFNILTDEDSTVAEIIMPYVWSDSNIDSIGCMEFTYNQIADNFNVPIPELQVPTYGLFLDPLFNGFSASECLIHTSHTSSLSEYSYQRNNAGDIYRIDIDNGRIYYLIEYTD